MWECYTEIWYSMCIQKHSPQHRRKFGRMLLRSDPLIIIICIVVVLFSNMLRILWTYLIGICICIYIRVFGAASMCPFFHRQLKGALYKCSGLILVASYCSHSNLTNFECKDLTWYIGAIGRALFIITKWTDWTDFRIISA